LKSLGKPNLINLETGVIRPNQGPPGRKILIIRAWVNHKTPNPGKNPPILEGILIRPPEITPNKKVFQPLIPEGRKWWGNPTRAFLEGVYPSP